MIVNRSNIIIGLAALIFFASCQDLKKSEKPEDLIPEAKMIDVLTELSLMYAARNYNKQKLENTGIEPDSYIYEKFGIDSLQFERSNDWYSEQYADYERIYDSVKVRLQLMKSKLDSVRELEVEMEDSLKKAKQDSVKALDTTKMSLKQRDSLKMDSIKGRKLKEVGDQRKDSLLPPAMSAGNNS